MQVYHNTAAKASQLEMTNVAIGIGLMMGSSNIDKRVGSPGVNKKSGMETAKMSSMKTDSLMRAGLLCRISRKVRAAGIARIRRHKDLISSA